ncbi:hypothetical protein A3N68_14890 [Enterobacter asburiae]|nr:hypothetical protein A3N68_14890 [Enterobacter asburiae]
MSALIRATSGWCFEGATLVIAVDGIALLLHAIRYFVVSGNDFLKCLVRSAAAPVIAAVIKIGVFVYATEVKIFLALLIIGVASRPRLLEGLSIANIFIVGRVHVTDNTAAQQETG